MAHYFTADTHFGDDGIRRFFERPFSSTDSMDAAMLARAGAVGDDDYYWHLGDFAVCRTDGDRALARRAFEQLPGRKHLVCGNHDSDWICALPWASVHDLVEIDAGSQRFVLCHYPLLTWNGARLGALHLFGHVHTRWRGARGAVNVGVDEWSFRPASAQEAELEAMLAPPSKLHQLIEGRV